MSTPTDTPSPRPSIRLLAWYSSGNAANGIYGACAAILVFYYNQVLGVSASLIGLTLLAASIFDAVSDPIIGGISDRTRSRLGRRHPYMLLSALPLGLIFYFIWVPPEYLINSSYGTSAVLSWLVFWLFMQRLFSTFYNVPYMAFGAEISHDYQERTLISNLRANLGNIGAASSSALLFLFFLAPTAEYANGQLNPEGYPRFALAFGITIAVLFFFGAWKTRSIGAKLSTPRTTKISIFSIALEPFLEVISALKYRSFRSITFAAILNGISGGVATSLGLYMATFFWQVPLEVLFLFGVGMFGGNFVGYAIWQKASHYFEKKTIYIIGAAGYLIAFVGPYFLRTLEWWPPVGTPWYTIFYILITGFIAHIFVSACTIMTSSMLGDVTDEDELATGKRREGIIFGAESLSIKMVNGLGPVLAGIIIDFAGITANTQVHEVSHGIITLLGLGLGISCGILFLLSILFVSFYDLNRNKHQNILKQLAA